MGWSDRPVPEAHTHAPERAQKQSLEGLKQSEVIQLQGQQIQQLEARLAALEAALSSAKDSKETVAP